MIERVIKALHLTKKSLENDFPDTKRSTEYIRYLCAMSIFSRGEDLEAAEYFLNSSTELRNAILEDAFPTGRTK